MANSGTSDVSIKIHLMYVKFDSSVNQSFVCLDRSTVISVLG